MKIAAVADLHFRKSGNEEVEAILGEMKEQAEALVLAGDLTDGGFPEEMGALLRALEKMPMPIVAVLGNHDHEHGQPEELSRMLREAGVRLLEGNACKVQEVGFAGTKGFCGGFGERLVQPFGEQIIKRFVQEGVDEAAHLGRGLAELEAPRKIAVLHYAPIESTLAGEPREIYAFLGTSWLGDALDRNGADLAVHGHAHQGSPQGRTARNIPVYNVSRFVLKRTSGRAYKLIEL